MRTQADSTNALIPCPLAHGHVDIAIVSRPALMNASSRPTSSPVWMWIRLGLWYNPVHAPNAKSPHPGFDHAEKGFESSARAPAHVTVFTSVTHA